MCIRDSSTTTVKRVQEIMSGDYAIYDAEVQSRKTGKIAKGVPFFNDWQLTQKRGTTSGDLTVQMMGYRNNAIAVQVKTGQGWSDGVSRPTLVFFDKTKVTGITTAPEPQPPQPAGCTPDEVIKHQQEGYDLALSVFPKRPGS